MGCSDTRFGVKLENKHIREQFNARRASGDITYSLILQIQNRLQAFTGTIADSVPLFLRIEGPGTFRSMAERVLHVLGVFLHLNWSNHVSAPMRLSQLSTSFARPVSTSACVMNQMSHNWLPFVPHIIMLSCASYMKSRRFSTCSLNASLFGPSAWKRAICQWFNILKTGPRVWQPVFSSS